MARDPGSPRRRPPVPPAATVVLLSLAMVLLGALALRVAPVAPAAPDWLGTVLLTALFAAAEVGVLHVQLRREAQTISLNEIPLVFGLRFLPVPGLLLARLIGSVLVFVVHRRQKPVKVLFNVALVWAGTATSVLVFSLVQGDVRSGPVTWLACFAATAAASCLDAVAVTAAIVCYEPGIRPREALKEVLASAAASALVTVFAVVGSDSFAADRSHVWLLLGAAAIVMLSYRAYASLEQRHLSLERLYRFSQVVTTSPEVDEILTHVLVQAKELLRAEVAEVTFIADLLGGGGARASVGASNRITHSEAGATDTRWLLRHVADPRSSVLLPLSTRDPDLRGYLTLRGLRDALVVPLRGDAGVVGALLVADRMGAVRSFDNGDMLLLETVSNHAGVALQNGRLVHRLRHDALHDALTGLPNRSMFQRTVTEKLDLPAPAGGGVSVMLMDLNRFKEVNDTLGHAAGDRLLQEVAIRLQSALGEEGLVARLGGDEFAVVLDTARPDDVIAVGRRLIDAAEHPMILDEVPVSVGLSIGVALGPHHGTSTAELLKHADIAMYEAKSSAAGLRLFDAAQVPADPSRLSMVSELREALQQRQLAVFVQPKALVDDGSVVTVEALVRWRHPERGLLPPDEFIALAERSGLIEPLTQFVLDASLAACASWSASGHRVGVAVNLSAQGLLNLDLVALVGRLLRRYALDPGLLTLEITESCIMIDPTQSIALLEELRDMGVRLSVDDFGTGYSSLSYLRQLPVQEVKVDRSFVGTMTTQPDNETIVRSIVNLSSSLGLDVVAEGVEDDRTWHLLHQMGCTYAQGYLISRPMPTEDFLGWLRGRTHGPALSAHAGPAAPAGVTQHARR